MRDIRRFFNRLSVKMITSIIFLVTILTVIVGFFSYQVFTRTMLNSVASNLGNIADNAENDSSKWKPQYYLEIGKERMDELQFNNYENLMPGEGEYTIGAVKSYFETEARLSYLCESHDVAIIANVRTEDRNTC